MNHPVGESAGRGENLAGDAEHFAVLFQRLIHRPAGAAFDPGLHHQRSHGDAADEAVAAGKAAGFRYHARRVFADHRPLLLNPPEQVRVFPGVNPVQPAGQHGDGAPAGLQRAAMGDAVDAQGQAADDGEAVGGQIAGEAGGGALAVFGGRAGADYRQAAVVGVRLQRAGIIQHRRRVGDLLQPQRVAPGVPVDRRTAGLFQRRQFRLGRNTDAGGQQLCDVGFFQPGGLQLAAVGAPGRLQLAEIRLQPAKADGAKLRQAAEGQPVFQVVGRGHQQEF